ncbi:hypothetical protein GGR54DRAFT_311277 [Hypoxylon sp. NC1633]|nr:hypothetical protein GGR54DRAFT_311277 [Hypoxylon sp. NC1633]
MSNIGNTQPKGENAGHQDGGTSSTIASSGPNFNALYSQKRSTGQESIDKRKSITDQYSSTFVGRMWSRWVSGSGPTT